MRYVVDTNVSVVANGQRTNASAECRLRAIDFLEEMMTKGRLVLDLSGEVEEEYRSNLSVGQPGVGNRFLQSFLTSAARRVERIEILRDANGNYIDFPSVRALKKFDPSDRKFAALSCKSRAPVAAAVDGDWLDASVELGKHRIRVKLICGCDRSRWFHN